MIGFEEHFDNYVCAGDSITCEVRGVTYTARLDRDSDIRPHEYDSPGCCFDTKDPKYGAKNRRIIKAWENDEWHYFSVIISAEFEGHEVDYLAILGGIEGNFPRHSSFKGNTNAYFREVANDLLGEAVEAFEGELEALKVKLLERT